MRLCRFPTVFTAMADVFAGFLLTHASLSPLPQFLGLLAASAGLYLSGMVWNDVFDVAQDQQERPQRPLPSGTVSRTGAVRFAAGLMALGLLAAGCIGIPSLAVALLLAAAILLYDRFLKRTLLGPLAMGSCRFLNILLGASAAGAALSDVWRLPQIWLALALGTYVAGVTWFARTEARQSSRLALIGGCAVLNAGLAMLALWIIDALPAWGIPIPRGAVRQPMNALFIWGVIGLTINRRAWAAIADPEPALVQLAVGIMLLSIISLDALLIYVQLGDAGIPFALGTLALAVPAVLLRRWIPLT
jgi:4-hydroxybenzoate polyprenyltransferase